jgi:hypothetical protein
VGGGGRVVILDPSSEIAEPVALEGSAASIWLEIDGIRSIDQVLQKLSSDFGVSAESVRDEVSIFISSLHARNLLIHS